MIPLSLAQIADIVGGELLDAMTATRQVDSVTIDSRTAGTGSLFVALPGEHTDGHRFVGAAVAAGAAGAVVAADRADQVAAGAPAVVVDDPGDALLGLGMWVRDTVDPLVIGITGSNGKTTTKDLVSAAIAPSRPTVANQGSFNNELGVPLTCCRLEADSEVLVSEIGMRGKGQIAELAGLLRPSIGVVTSVAAVHLELLGSLEAIASAKGELVEALPHDGVAVLAADDPLVTAMGARTSARVVTFGRLPDADWHARDVVLDDRARATFTVESPHGEAVVHLPVPGLHNVGNALAALATAAEAGVDLPAAVAGLERAAVSRWRLQLREITGVRVLNDAYNANPTSTTAALHTLSQLPTGGRRWAVLGTMAEIGATSAQEHRRVGATVAELGIHGLVTVGPVAAAIREGANAADPAGAARRWAVEDVDAAADLLASSVAAGDVVLVKASRSAALEGVVMGLERRLEGEGERERAGGRGSAGVPVTGEQRS
jgi:UDP-N-acetylmuramoyl-tripeptide--D-alanyl-D-alanine ligase